MGIPPAAGAPPRARARAAAALRPPPRRGPGCRPRDTRCRQLALALSELPTAYCCRRSCYGARTQEALPSSSGNNAAVRTVARGAQRRGGPRERALHKMRRGGRRGPRPRDARTALGGSQPEFTRLWLVPGLLGGAPASSMPGWLRGTRGVVLRGLPRARGALAPLCVPPPEAAVRRCRGWWWCVTPATGERCAVRAGRGAV